MSDAKNADILWGADIIADHAGISKPTFIDLVTHYKFPAVKIKGNWCAHRDEIDRWVRFVTTQYSGKEIGKADHEAGLDLR